MTMEKNGAISSDTPDQCCGGGVCGSEKKGGDPDPSKLEMGLKFPTTAEQADAMGNDVTGRLNELVKNASKP